MEVFGLMIGGALEALQVEFTLLGATLSYWQVMLWSIFIGLTVWIIASAFGG